METNIDGQSTWSRLVAQWQPAVLVTACVAGGLTLTTMVIGSTPDVIVQASQAAIEAAPVDTLVSDAPEVAEVPVDTASSTDSTEVVGPTAAPASGDVSAASREPATVVAPAPGPAPAVPSPAPTATPTTGTPSAPAPAPVVTSGPLAPVTVAAPQTTAAPTTAAPTPAPTTAAPTPTTVAPAASLTYPSYSAGAAATVVLQFDGSSISVASVTRQPNWVSQIEQNGPRSVEIKFFNTATRQDEEFHATVESGRIKVEN
jgi:hypothetical protein